MSYDRDYFRKMVDMIDGAAKPTVSGSKTQLSESKKQIVESKKRRVVAEAKKLAQLIENSDLTEAELNELFGGLGALGRRAGKGIAGAANKAGQGIAGAANKAGQAVGGAARAVGQAAGQAAGQAGQAIGGAANKVGQAAGQAGQAIGGAANKAGQAVSATASDWSQTYQKGELQDKAKNAMKTLASMQADLAALPTAADIVTKADNATIGEIKAALQAAASPPA